MTISATTRGLRPGVCTSTSRPGSPYDGQLIYETDTNRVAVYDSSAWVYKTPASTTGSVLQVVSVTKTDTFVASTSTYTDITGFSATITPTSTSSKILAIVTGSGSTVTILQLVRGSTPVFIGDTAGNRTLGSQVLWASAGNVPAVFGFAYLDSPNTSSSITYKVQGRSESGNSQFCINRANTDSDAANAFVRTASSITLMEIAG